MFLWAWACNLSKMALWSLGKPRRFSFSMTTVSQWLCRAPGRRISSLSAFAFGSGTVTQKTSVTPQKKTWTLNKNTELNNRQYFKQDTDVHSVFREHQTFSFPSWCPVWMESFGLERVLLQSRGGSRGDTGWWMTENDERACDGMRAQNEGGSCSALASYSCLSLGKPCHPREEEHSALFWKGGEPPVLV